MRKIIIGLLLNIVFISIVSAAKLPLWKIETAQGNAYLLGSIHIFKAKMYPLDKKIISAYQNTDKLVVEANIKAINQMQFALQMQQLGLYTDGETIAQHISAHTLQQLKTYMQENGLSYALLKTMRPWFLSIMLLTHKTTLLGYDQRSGVDMHFLNRATAEKKPILELESAAMQLQLLSKPEPDRVQELSLKATLEQLPQLQQIMQKMITAWQEGDLDVLLAIAKQPEKKYPVLKTSLYELLDKRNIAMVEKIQHYLQSKESYFIVVGAAHLAGEKGLIALLSKGGAKVTQIMTP